VAEQNDLVGLDNRFVKYPSL